MSRCRYLSRSGLRWLLTISMSSISSAATMRRPPKSLSVWPSFLSKVRYACLARTVLISTGRPSPVSLPNRATLMWSRWSRPSSWMVKLRAATTIFLEFSSSLRGHCSSGQSWPKAWRSLSSSLSPCDGSGPDGKWPGSGGRSAAGSGGRPSMPPRRWRRACSPRRRRRSPTPAARSAWVSTWVGPCLSRLGSPAGVSRLMNSISRLTPAARQDVRASQKSGFRNRSASRPHSPWQRSTSSTTSRTAPRPPAARVT